MTNQTPIYRVSENKRYTGDKQEPVTEIVVNIDIEDPREELAL